MPCLSASQQKHRRKHSPTRLHSPHLLQALSLRAKQSSHKALLLSPIAHRRLCPPRTVGPDLASLNACPSNAYCQFSSVPALKLPEIPLSVQRQCALLTVAYTAGCAWSIEWSEQSACSFPAGLPRLEGTHTYAGRPVHTAVISLVIPSSVIPSDGSHLQPDRISVEVQGAELYVTVPGCKSFHTQLTFPVDAEKSLASLHSRADLGAGQSAGDLVLLLQQA